MRLKHVSIWLVAVGCLTTVLEGQKGFWGSPQAYLGQTRPSDTPQIFAPDLLTEPGTIAMDHIAFSRDGREIYYLQSDRWGSLAHAQIKTFRYNGHRWGAYVTPDSKYLFYTRGTSAKDSAIYWVRFDTLLESLRPKQH